MGGPWGDVQVDDVQHRDGPVAEAGDLLRFSSSVCQSRRCPLRQGGRCPLALELDKFLVFGLMDLVISDASDDFQIRPCIWTATHTATWVVNRRTLQTPEWTARRFVLCSLVQAIYIFTFYIYILHIPSNLRICTIYAFLRIPRTSAATAMPTPETETAGIVGTLPCCQRSLPTRCQRRKGRSCYSRHSLLSTSRRSGLRSGRRVSGYGYG